MAHERAYAGRRVAVLGASGFIGAHVVRALARRGAEVHAFVRPRSGAAPAGRDVPAGCDPVRHALDLRDARAVGEGLGRLRPALVFNLAGYGVDRDERDPAEAEALNAVLPARLAEALAAAREGGDGPPAVLVHAGSALEYGRAGGELAEDSEPAPDTLYGRTKLAGTEGLREAARRLGLPALTARLFTVYGPGEHPGRLLPTLLAAARDPGRRPIPLSAGLQRRDFTWVGDVAEGLLRLGAAAAEPGEVVNLATGRLESVRRFAETAAEVLGIARERLAFGALPTRSEEMEHDPVSIRRLRELTGWAPETSIAEGVRRTQEAEETR